MPKVYILNKFICSILLSFVEVQCSSFDEFNLKHSYDILGARMLWKPKEARILKNFIDQPV
jgi:hypothetical protein